MPIGIDWETGEAKVIVQPQSGGQERYLSTPLNVFEALYYGDVGSGKSWNLIIDALGLQYQSKIGKKAIDFPDYKAFIFRRTSKRLNKLVDEAKAFYKYYGGVYAGTKQNEPGSSFTFPGGARVFMCYMEHEKDKFNFQGEEAQFMGFDEVTEFLIGQYSYLFSRCRSKIPGITPRVRSTANAIGVGLKWVRNRFIYKMPAGTVKYFLPPSDIEKDPRGSEAPKGTPKALSRMIIHGKISDNKILLENDPEYIDRIYAMGDKYVKALLQDDWFAFEGQAFDKLSRRIHLVQPREIPRHWKKIAGLDYGNVVALEGATFDPSTISDENTTGNAYFFAEWTSEDRERDEEIDGLKYYLKENNLKDLQIVYDTDMESTNSKVKSDKTAAWYFKNDTKYGFKLNMTPVSKGRIEQDTNFRVSCNRIFWNGLNWKKDERGMWLRKPKIYFIAQEPFTNPDDGAVAVCNELFESMFDLMLDPKMPEDILKPKDGGVPDHHYAAGRYALITGIKSEGLTQEEKKQIEKAVEQDIEESLW
jgi:hypothetical protein